jgi:hypothetical protein
MMQQHLSYADMTNYGCFYTPEKFVDNLIEKIKNNILNFNKYKIIDTSCGYGSFFLNNKFNGCEIIANDIDPKAVSIARQNIVDWAKFFTRNALKEVTRIQYELNDNDKIIIIGNPPYNDVTSKVKNAIKNNKPCEIDNAIKTRDLGISFLLSYNKLKADYVAVLHPLSYMIKRPNYNLLKPFYNNYEILDATIINSQEFSLTSKGTGFPICIILYKRSNKGTTYNEIMNKNWRTIDDKTFNFNLNSIRNYISKYPSKYKIWDKQAPLFWTMRDINALKRNQTFIDEYCENAIIVDKNKLPYYCYVDTFKDYTEHIPYYFGNCDVFIDENEFSKIKNDFIIHSIKKHPKLKQYFNDLAVNYSEENIDNYFKRLLGENYVYKTNY